MKVLMYCLSSIYRLKIFFKTDKKSSLTTAFILFHTGNIISDI